jgi:hypothetical protein
MDGDSGSAALSESPRNITSATSLRTGWDISSASSFRSTRNLTSAASSRTHPHASLRGFLSLRLFYVVNH